MQQKLLQGSEVIYNSLTGLWLGGLAKLFPPSSSIGMHVICDLKGGNFVGGAHRDVPLWGELGFGGGHR